MDSRVAALNASIETRLRRFEQDHGHLPEIRMHVESQRAHMAEHQPEGEGGGRWNAPCRGEHAEPTPWPCDQMQKWDNPMAYML